MPTVCHPAFRNTILYTGFLSGYTDISPLGKLLLGRTSQPNNGGLSCTLKSIPQPCIENYRKLLVPKLLVAFTTEAQVLVGF